MVENDDNIHAGHRQRLKDRFLKCGFEGMDDHVVLEMLLFYSIPRRDTNPLAHRLINHFGSLKEVFCASYQELRNIEGVGENTALLITMIPKLLTLYMNEENEKYRRRKLTREEIGQFAVNALASETVEAVLLMCIKREMIVHDCILARGDKSQVDFRINDISRLAILNGCDSVAIAHLHFGNHSEPSMDDYRATRNIRAVLEHLNIRLTAHYIVNNGKYTCMSEIY